jgi:CubicO group peptidase (beta-lactamase class C family)
MKSWDSICKERLFVPLGAKSLSFELPPERTPLVLSPQPAALPSRVPAFEDFSPGHPAGGCTGTIGDVLKVMNFHLQGGRWNGKTLIEPELFKEMHTVQFAKQIAEAQKAGIAPPFKSWGLGVLVRGTGPDDPGYQDYGFDGRSTPSMFGQNGITTIVTAADPTLDAAFVFATTDSPKPESKTVELWNGVSKRVFDALSQ